MAGKRVEKSWTWHLKATREALWPLVSDTERINEALRLPRYRLRETVSDEGLHRRYGEYDDRGTLVRWEEPPFEWSTDHWWRWDRLYDAGPMERTRGTLVLEPDPKGGTVATYTLVAEPRSLTGAILARTGHLGEAGKAFERLLKVADAHARNPQGDFFANLAATRTGARKRRKGEPFQVPDDTAPGDKGLAKQLLSWLAVAFESDLRDIRAKRVARVLGVGIAEAHKAMVIGVEMGALEQRFRLICPSCHCTLREAETPRDLPRSIDCSHCDAAVEKNYTHSVEVIFTPHAAIREPSTMVYCASGPALSPRIVLQQILEPHERRALPATLPKGAYSIRSLDGRAHLTLDAEGGRGALIRMGDDWVEVPEIAETVILENHGEQVATMVVAKADWPPEATSLGEWLTYQRCRKALAASSMDLDEPQDAGTLSLVVISSRSVDELTTCYAVALTHGGAVVEDTGSGIVLVFGQPADAQRAIDTALQALPAARIGADHGPLWLTTDARYAGDPRDRVADLAGLAQEGVPNLSAAFRGALAP